MENINEEKKEDSDPLISFKSSSAETNKTYQKEIDEDRFIWDYDELL
jgi:hypothetical protein